MTLNEDVHLIFYKIAPTATVDVKKSVFDVLISLPLIHIFPDP